MANQYSVAMDEPAARKLWQKLRGTPSLKPCAREYALFCFEGEGVNVAYFEKRGRLLVQGREAEDFVRLTLGEEALMPAEGVGKPAPLHPDEAVKAHFGVDESGKGDYFGPLVVAGVYADEHIAPILAKIGCRDSKQIGSDAQIARMAGEIKQAPGVIYELLCIGPQRYNELYAEMGNLNRLLAWGHARVIAALHAKAPSCPRALSDQFANEWVLRRALGARAVPVKLEQRPRAEEDIAVAAASILARARFVEWMQQAARAAACELPLGCAPHVTQAARAFVAKHGPERLGEVAKLHFKVTKQVLS